MAIFNSYVSLPEGNKTTILLIFGESGGGKNAMFIGSYPIEKPELLVVISASVWCQHGNKME